MTKYYFSVALIISSFIGVQAQTYTSQQDGPWNVAATWDLGAVPPPDALNSNAIFINHNVSIPTGYSVSIDEAFVSGGASLTVNTGGTLTLATDNALTVDGTLAAQNGSILSVPAAANLTLNGTYQHLFTTAQGTIPLAIWGPASIVEILGYTTFTTATAAGNWSQDFYRVIWNCTNQTSTVNLAGLLTSIGENFEVQSTGSGFLQLSADQNPQIFIAGNLEISGTSRVTFSTTGVAPGAIIDVSNDLIFTSTNPTTGTRLATTGVATMNVGRDVLIDATGGLFNLSSGNAGNGTLNIAGNFDLTNGTVTETGGTTSTGFINFINNTVGEHTFNNTGTISNRISYSVDVDNTLRVVGESQVVGGALSALNVLGNLIVESTDILGAIQTGSGVSATGGNIRVVSRTYDANSTVMYGANTAQFIGTGHTNVLGTTIIFNPEGVSVAAGALVTVSGDLLLSTGSLNVSSGSMTINGDLDLEGGNLNFTTIGTARTLVMNGNVNLNGGEIIVTSGTANATMTLNGTLSGSNFISFTGANSNLTIGGTGDLGMDFPLPTATTLELLTINRPGSTIVFNEDLTLGSAGVTNCIVLTNGNLDLNSTTVAVRGILLEAGTILHFEDQVLEMQRTFTSNGGTLSSNSASTLNVTTNSGAVGTLVFDAAGNTLGTFTMNRTTAGTLVTLNSPLTVTNTFTLANGDFLNTSGLSFGSGANVTRDLQASFVAGSAIPAGGPYNLFYTGTGTGSLPTSFEARGSLNNLTTNFPGTVVLASPAAGVGTLFVNAGTFNCGTNSLSMGNAVITTIFGASSSTVTLTGDLTNNGTFNRNNGTVIFAGTSSLLGTNINTTSFNNITISGALTAPTTLNLFGNFTNNGIFTSGTGTVVFQGSATLKSIAGSSTTNFYNITANAGTANPDLEVLGSANLINVLTLAANVVVDADGSTGAGVFTILSTGDNPTVDGSIATLPVGASVTGNLTVQRYMSGEGRIYRYISSPVSGASIASWQDDFTITGTFSDPSVSGPICGFPVTSASPSLYRYDETMATSGTTDLGWIAYPASGTAASNPLTVGAGYSPFIRECTVPTVIDVTGPANQGNVNVNLRFTNQGDPLMDGYNLVGNPYPSAINWQAAGWVRSANIGTVIAIRDNGAGGTYTYFDYSDGSATDYIASGQAFWVRATVDNQSLGFREATKVSASAIFHRTIADNTLTISVTRAGITDKAFLKVNPEATARLDRFDGPKLPNANFDLSTLSQESIPMAINAMNEITCGVEIPLNFKYVTNPNGNYTLDFSPSGLFADLQMTLIDTHTGKSVNVKQNPTYQYSIDNAASSRAPGRFKIVFDQNPIALDLGVSDSDICGDESVEITIEGTQPGVAYTATLGETVISETIHGDGLDQKLFIPADKFLFADNNVTIKANGLCYNYSLSDLAVVRRESLKAAQVSSVIKCQTGSVGLKVEGPVEGVRYRWYENETSTEAIAEGTEFLTPVLDHSRTYAVAAVNRLGCEGPRTVATAEVVTFNNAEISLAGESMLQSNFETGNQWYLNGEAIFGAVSQQLAATESGNYKVEVAVNGCSTSAEYEFVILASEGNINTEIDVYPNPVSGDLAVTFKNKDRVKSVSLIDNLGKSIEVKGHNQIVEGKMIFVMTPYPAGVYFVKVQGSDYLSILKVIKK